jgi:hypothetical protein
MSRSVRPWLKRRLDAPARVSRGSPLFFRDSVVDSGNIFYAAITAASRAVWCIFFNLVCLVVALVVFLVVDMLL